MLLARRLGFVRTPAAAAEDSWVPVKSAGEAAPPPGDVEAVAFVEQERAAASRDFVFEQLERPALVEPPQPPGLEGLASSEEPEPAAAPEPAAVAVEAAAFVEQEWATAAPEPAAIAVEATASRDFAFEQLECPALVEPPLPPPGLEGLASSEEPEPAAVAVVVPPPPLRPPPWHEEASWRSAARAELAGVASLPDVAAALWRLRAASAQLSWRAFFRRCNRLGLCLSSMVCHHADLARRLQQDRSMRLPRWALKTEELRIVQRAFAVRLR
jgi:hypothetical protein